MSRLPTLAASLLLGAAVSACAPTTNGLTADNNPSLYSVHQPVVQRTDYVIDLSTAGGGLAPSEADRLHAWLHSVGAGYGDRLSVDEPQGYSDPAARTDIVRIAGQYGLVVDGAPPVLNGEVQPGSIRVIASRATAHVPNCPDWGHRGDVPKTTTSSNYGCAVNSNLAAMVANPEDLVLGQDGGTAGSGTTASRAVRTYRERPLSGAQALPATTGGDQ